MNENVYVENGYKDWRDYLMNLAEEFDIPYKTVAEAASMLGPGEDFDGLVSTLEDEFG
jgi:hypothetical protein